MSRRRQARVTELIQQEISKRIPFLKDPGLGFITILAVRMTPDFNQAKVFYSVLGTPDEKTRTQAALERAKGYFRSELGSLENLKHPPELLFVLDNSAEEAQKVFELMSQLEKEREASKAPAEKPNPDQP
jgi:ribosome-binding factor A